MGAVPASVLVAAFAVALAVPVLGWSLIARPGAAAVQARDNLIRGIQPVGPAVGAAARTRLLGRLAGWLTPGGTVARLNRLAGATGRPAAWPVSRLLAAKLVLPLVAGSFGLLILSGGASTLTVLVAVVLPLVAYFLPEILLHSRGSERKEAIQLELPDTLDQMTIAVEAGLGFESAMAQAGANGTGPLAEELVRTLQDIAVGHPRREAYLSLADRTGVQDLRRFIAPSSRPTSTASRSPTCCAPRRRRCA